ncbi:F-box [Sarocladium implicatum]|nr:F-box [Sarocladium implicatum]
MSHPRREVLRKCERCDGYHHSEYDAELETLALVPTLPFDVQYRIFSFCGTPAIHALSQLNKEWYERFLPLLWQNIDFGAEFGDKAEGASARFFTRCCQMMEDDPERFATLASYVRRLDVGSVNGLEINVAKGRLDNAVDDNLKCTFDVIAMFSNLESLSIYVRVWWDFGSPRLEAGAALARRLRNLKSLKIGGHVPIAVLKGLLANGHSLEDLTLINLISTPGQDDGPDPVTFLSDEDCARLSNLQKLHLCKLADLDGRARYRHEYAYSDEDDAEGEENGEESDADSEESEYVSGMRWAFPRRGELKVLAEWAKLLQHTSETIQSLTLENRFLCGHSWMYYDSDFIEPGKTHPDDYGSVSIAASQRILLPVLQGQDWPELKELTLVGMGSSADNVLPLAHLKDRVNVHQLPSRWQLMTGDATPEEVSVPYEFEHDGIHRPSYY